MTNEFNLKKPKVKFLSTDLKSKSLEKNNKTKDDCSSDTRLLAVKKQSIEKTSRIAFKSESDNAFDIFKLLEKVDKEKASNKYFYIKKQEYSLTSQLI